MFVCVNVLRSLNSKSYASVKHISEKYSTRKTSNKKLDIWLHKNINFSVLMCILYIVKMKLI